MMIVQFLCALGILALMYSVVYAKERWCPWFRLNSNFTISPNNNNSSSNSSSNNNNNGASEKKSKTLWFRLTPEERTLILKHFFEKRMFLYKNEAIRSDQVCGETGQSAEMIMEQESSDDPAETSNVLVESARESESEIYDDVEKGQVVLKDEKNDQTEVDTAEKSMVEVARECEPEIPVLHDQDMGGDVVVLDEGEKNDVTDGDSEKGEVVEAVDVDDRDHERTCCVCLNEYDEGSPLITGTQCLHVFHYECCMAWFNKSVQCPYCRRPMITEAELLQAASDVLESQRFLELGKVDSLPDGPSVSSSSTINVVGVSPSTNISPTLPSDENEAGQANPPGMILTSP